ncbi:MAG: tetratricopeptide repeat protein [Prevotella sp.]|nr:tetratricopeptide repeat protein [Prevotella sp.]
MKMSKYCKMLFVIALAFIPVFSWADNDRQYVRSGNKYYRAEQYDKAELEYKKALSANEQNTQAMYNLGCAMMMQQQDSMAIEQFKMSGAAENNKVRKAMSYHNIGVIFQMHQEYDKAIEFYKEALRNNPRDHETRYNLALCQQLLKNQPKQNKNKDNQNQDKDKQNQDKDKQNQDKDKQNQDKDKQDQDKDKQNQDKQNQDKDKQNQDKQNQDKDQQNQDKQDQKQQGQQGEQKQMSRENAEQLLNAAVQDEKNTQQRLQKAMQQPQRRGLQKNW